MSRPLTPSLSPSEGERVPEGRVRGIQGSWPQLTSKFWRCSLPMNRPPHPFPLPIRWGEGGRRPGEGWFMVPMHAEKRKGALHEPQRVGSIALASCPWTSVRKFQENEKLITPPLCAPFAPPGAPGEQPMNSSRAPQPSLHPDPLGRQHATSQQWAVDAPANSPRPRPYCRY